MLEIMQILAITAQLGIKVFAIKGNWTLDGSLQSKILAMVFSLASEIERELISACTKEVLKVLKRKGIKFCRPKGIKSKSKLNKYGDEIVSLHRTGRTQKYIVNRYKCHESTLYNWLRKNGYNRQGLINGN